MKPIKLARQQQAAAAKAKLQAATARLRANGGMAPSVLARFDNILSDAQIEDELENLREGIADDLYHSRGNW